MRPIDRGAVPLDKNGLPKQVREYGLWRKDLIGRLGPYCCYCNMRLNDSPQVEHVIAQSLDPSKALEWENLLLACGPCNRAKGHQPCDPITHYLPDAHNTHLAFEYVASGPGAAFVSAKSAGIDPIKANNSIQLCALDRDTTASKTKDKVTDLRHQYRFEAMANAKLWRGALDTWAHSDLTAFVPLLKTVVEAKGFWSVWYATFADVPAIRQMLVEDIPGTSRGSFGTDFLPQARSPRQAGDAI